MSNKSISLDNLSIFKEEADANYLSSDVLTTQGDILYQGSSSASKLSIGSNNQILSSSGSAPQWSTLKTLNSTSLLGSGDISLSGITELSSQYIRITNLSSGIYKLTYNGTKYIYYNGSSSTSSHTVTGSSGVVILHVNKYASSYWHWWYINGTTSYATLYFGYTTSSSGSTTSKSLSSIYTGTPTDTKPQYLYHYNTDFTNTSSYSIYRYQILMFNGTGLSAFTSTSNTTGTTKNQLALKYYPGAPIVYYSNTSTVSNNSTFTGSYLYNFYYSIDLRYSFNIGTSTLTTYKPVYIKMSVNSDGSLSPVYSATSGGHPLVQTLPSTADGYVYVYLGQTTSTSYYLDLELNHPCYEYVDGKIRPYTQATSGSGSGSASGVSYLTTAPSSANTSGLKFVVLSSEPATKYDGYFYIITSSN